MQFERVQSQLDTERVSNCDKLNEGQRVKERRSEIFLAEVQATLTGTLMVSLSNCPTGVGERVCSNLAHSLLSCSSVAVCVMVLAAGHHFF